MVSNFVNQSLACCGFKVGNMHGTATSLSKDAIKLTHSTDCVLGITTGRSTVEFVVEVPHSVLVLIENRAAMISGVDDLVSAVLLGDSCCDRLQFRNAGSPIYCGWQTQNFDPSELLPQGLMSHDNCIGGKQEFFN